MTTAGLIDYLQQFPANTRVILADDENIMQGEPFIELAHLDFGDNNPKAQGTHASDCATWVSEPCNCITGRDSQ